MVHRACHRQASPLQPLLPGHKLVIRINVKSDVAHPGRQIIRCGPTEPCNVEEGYAFAPPGLEKSMECRSPARLVRLYLYRTDQAETQKLSIEPYRGGGIVGRIGNMIESSCRLEFLHLTTPMETVSFRHRPSKTTNSPTSSHARPCNVS